MKAKSVNSKGFSMLIMVVMVMLVLVGFALLYIRTQNTKTPKKESTSIIENPGIDEAHYELIKQQIENRGNEESKDYSKMSHEEFIKELELYVDSEVIIIAKSLDEFSFEDVYDCSKDDPESTALGGSMPYGKNITVSVTHCLNPTKILDEKFSATGSQIESGYVLDVDFDGDGKIDGTIKPSQVKVFDLREM